MNARVTQTRAHWPAWRMLCLPCFARKNCRSAPPERVSTGRTASVYAKIDEEIEEVKDASSEAHREEEIGDLLFAVVNLARHLKVDSEQALRLANAKLRSEEQTYELQSLKRTS